MTLTELIQSQGRTVAWVSRQSGISRFTIYKMNDPAHRPLPETAKAVAGVLGIDPELLLAPPAD